MLMEIRLFVEENIRLQLNCKYYNTVGLDQESVITFHLDIVDGDILCKIQKRHPASWLC